MDWCPLILALHLLLTQWKTHDQFFKAHLTCNFPNFCSYSASVLVIFDVKMPSNKANDKLSIIKLSDQDIAHQLKNRVQLCGTVL
jgi:hypothetical protein